MKPLQRVIYPILLLSLFLTYQVSISLFTHVHYVDGVWVTHSHPAKKTHSHTKSEHIVIDRLATFNSLELDSPLNLEVQLPLLVCVEVPTHSFVVSRMPFIVPSLRAPPAVLFL